MRTQFTSTKQQAIKPFGFLALVMMLFLFANPVQAQEGQTVAGVVKSNDGPLFGATIVLKGTNIGVISNGDGEFTFPKQLNENDVLVVSYLGYKNAEITITENTRYVEPFLKDDPIVVVAALRTTDDLEQSSYEKPN